MKTPCIVAAFLVALMSSPAAQAACPSPSSDQTIQVPGHPFAAESSPDNCHLFVSLMPRSGKGSLAVLDNQGGVFHVARVITMPRGSGGGLTLDHKGDVLAVAAEDAVVFFDVAKLTSPEQDAVTGVIPESENGVIYTQFSADDALLFVSEERNASLGVIDVSAALKGAGGKALTGRIPVGRAPVGLALSADGSHLFSTSEVASASQDCKGEQDGAPRHGKGAVYAIDIAKAASEPRKAVTSMILAGCNPVRVVASPDGHALWVSQRGDGRLMGFDASLLARGTPGRALTIEIGNSPVGLALRPDGKQLWVADSDRFGREGGSLALVEMVSPTEIKIAQSVKVGKFPRDLRFLPDGKTLVVALFGDDAVLLHLT
jgi:DNA-binding beta-propeller fold protein YncE